MPHLFSPSMLFALCDAAGLRPVDIARALQVSRATVTCWRQGTQTISKAHYAELVRVAYSPGTFWRLLHRMRTGQIQNDDPAHGYHFAIAQSPDDYQGWIQDAFRAAVGQVNELVAGDASAWNYDTLRTATRTLAEMADAMAIIMVPEQKDPLCPDIITTDENAR